MAKGKSSRIKGNVRPFEGTPGNDSFALITRSMMASKAWNDMGIPARYLYLELKARYTRDKTGNYNDQAINLPLSQVTFMNKRTFFKARDELVSHGFIVIRFNGKWHRQPNDYGLSDQWKYWPEVELKTLAVRTETDD